MNASGNKAVSVEPVSGRSDLNDFIAVPWSIYHDDKQWIPPLLFEQRQRFSAKNPFFEHARWQAWTARRDGRLVGRISAQIDELHQQRYGDHTGYFGMIEGDDDPAVFSALLGVAERWLREQGMVRVRGPFNLSINEECGLLIDGFDTPPYIMMGHACPYYGAHIEAAGYYPVQNTLAYHVNPNFETPRVMARLAERAAGQVTVRPLRRKHLAEDLEHLRDIFNDAWSNNWGFVPFTESEFKEIGKTLTLLISEDFVQIAEIDGRPVAMIVVLPNINEAAADINGRMLPFGWAKLLWRLKVRYPSTARVPLMGVRKEFQRSRLGPTLAFLVIDAVRKAVTQRGIRDVEMSWILESNDGMRNIIESIGGVAYKRYRLYEQAL